MQDWGRWVNWVHIQNSLRRKQDERCKFLGEANEKNVEYFEEKIAATEELEKRVWLVVAALEGKPEVSEWARKVSVTELLADKSRGLRVCFAGTSVAGTTYMDIWISLLVLSKMMKIPEIAEHLVECMSVSQNMYYLEHYEKRLRRSTGSGFTREHCLARNGAALRQRKIICSPGKIKRLIKLFRLSKSDLASVGVPWPA